MERKKDKSGIIAFWLVLIAIRVADQVIMEIALHSEDPGYLTGSQRLGADENVWLGRKGVKRISVMTGSSNFAVKYWVNLGLMLKEVYLRSRFINLTLDFKDETELFLDGSENLSCFEEGF